MNKTKLVELLIANERQILTDWVQLQSKAGTLRRDLVSEDEVRRQSAMFLTSLIKAIQESGTDDIRSAAYEDVRGVLADLTANRANQGFSPAETATFVFSLKQPIFSLAQDKADPGALLDDIWRVNVLLDRLGLYTTEVFIKNRDAIIQRQNREMIELSTPVVKLWENILALPLIGTLDSARTQVVMENLLQEIVNTGASIAIIDITGVPTVDTLVAQHLLKTVSAARLMGADCIISGIRPQIAQTIVHLGVQLNEVTTKSSLADAFSQALSRTGQKICRV